MARRLVRLAGNIGLQSISDDEFKRKVEEMLPDLRRVKESLQKINMEYISVMARQMTGILSAIDSHAVHEGRSMQVDRADGSISESSFQTASGEISIDIDEAKNMTPDRRIEILNSIAGQLASSMTKNLFEHLNDELEAAGQVVSMKDQGSVSGVEIIFKMMQKIEISFRDDGTVKNLSIVAGHDVRPHVLAGLREISQNPELNERYNKMMSEKWEKWRAREANRKLVG